VCAALLELNVGGFFFFMSTRTLTNWGMELMFGGAFPWLIFS